MTTEPWTFEVTLSRTDGSVDAAVVTAIELFQLYSRLDLQKTRPLFMHLREVLQLSSASIAGDDGVRATMTLLHGRPYPNTLGISRTN